MPSVADAMRDALVSWYADQLSAEDQRNIMGAGLHMTEKLRRKFPFAVEDYRTPKGQVRGLGGKPVLKILRRHGVDRPLGTEVGRTTRGTLPAVEDLLARWDGIPGTDRLTDEERGRIADALQAWLIERVKEYFARQRLTFDANPRQPASRTIRAILDAAAERGRGPAGAVAQHLVGAKLARRYPHLSIPNHPATASDASTGRLGDFELGDTVFHVSVQPMPSLFEKLRAVRVRGMRSLVLVRENRVAATQQMAEMEGVPDAQIEPIERFVGQNLEEMAHFHHQKLAGEMVRLLETYNARVAQVEADQSLQIEVPQGLERLRNPQEGT